MIRPSVRSWATSRASLLATFVALFILVAIWTARLYGDAINLETLRRLPDAAANLNPLRTRPENPFRDPSNPLTHHHLPPKIWQISLPKNPSDPAGHRDINPESLVDSASWLAKNPDFEYTLVDDVGGEAFVRTHFGNRPDILEAYMNMPNVGMRSDLLRYLILSAEGGVYTDTDTVALKPIDAWIPDEFRDKAKVVVGIEFDRLHGGPWADINHWVQFCQWTIAAAPGHPLFMRMVDRVIASLADLSNEYNVPVSKIKPTSFQVMNSTGPAAWTDVVFDTIQGYEHWLRDTRDLSALKGPKMYGDVLVLTINGFGMGQMHSNSANNGTVPEEALVRHLFRGSWREEQVEEKSEEEGKKEEREALFERLRRWIRR